jgi:hypothetical protein
MNTPKLAVGQIVVVLLDGKKLAIELPLTGQ